jgi:hypothetical protein
MPPMGKILPYLEKSGSTIIAIDALHMAFRW